VNARKRGEQASSNQAAEYRKGGKAKRRRKHPAGPRGRDKVRVAFGRKATVFLHHLSSEKTRRPKPVALGSKKGGKKEGKKSLSLGPLGENNPRANCITLCRKEEAQRQQGKGKRNLSDHVGKERFSTKRTMAGGDSAFGGVRGRKKRSARSKKKDVW